MSEQISQVKAKFWLVFKGVCTFWYEYLFVDSAQILMFVFA